MKVSRSRGILTPRWPFSGSGAYGFVPSSTLTQTEAGTGTEAEAAAEFQRAILVRQQARVTAARPQAWGVTTRPSPVSSKTPPPVALPGASETGSESSGAPAPMSMSPGGGTTAGEAGTSPSEASGSTAGAAEVQTMDEGAGSGPTMAKDELPAGEYVGGTELGPEAGVGVEEPGSRWPIYVGAGLGVLALVGVGFAIWGGSKKR